LDWPLPKIARRSSAAVPLVTLLLAISAPAGGDASSAVRNLATDPRGMEMSAFPSLQSSSWGTTARPRLSRNGLNRDATTRDTTSFARFAYFTDAELSPGGSPVWFISSDQIHGPVHSNGTFHISGGPHFYDAVTSVSDQMVGYPSYAVYDATGWPVGGNNPTFDEGFRLNVPLIPYPPQTADLRILAQNGGIYLTSATTIELGKRALGMTAPGWLRCRDTAPPGAWSDVQIGALTSGVIYCDGDVQTSGVLDGALTIASQTNIRIMDDVTYGDSDAGGVPSPECDDLLGLVAGGNIYFADFPPLTDNLKVDAVLMALNTSILAENYNSRFPSGTLTVWGGLIQKYRGPVGVFAVGGTLLCGYAKDYHYDPRMETMTPPGFPSTMPAQEGACCDTSSAQCTITPGNGCSTPGTWLGGGTTCSPNPCSPSSATAISPEVGDAFLGATPNPFTVSTRLSYQLLAGGAVRLEVFDVGGRRVRWVAFGATGPGIHSVEWDGRDADGLSAPSGTYFVRLTVGDRVWTQSLIKVH
jgi:hypothetical protein